MTNKIPIKKTNIMLISHLDDCSKEDSEYSIFPFHKPYNTDVSARLSKERCLKDEKCYDKVNNLILFP